MIIVSAQNELSVVISKYKEKFNRDIPGWRCSDEERLEALKEALESGVPYPEDDGETTY